MAPSSGPQRLTVRSERWVLREPFAISRELFTHSQMVVVEISDGIHSGRGECEPHESDAAAIGITMAAIGALEHKLTNGMTRAELGAELPAGPLRNALDCALWDLEAKRAGRRVWDLLDLPMLPGVDTAYTLGIDTPQAMAEKAVRYRAHRLIKIKLGGKDVEDLERVRAIRHARPDARLIVDANGGWTMARLREMAPALHGLNVELIEQPLPDKLDDELLDYRSPVPLCADESCLDRSSLDHVSGRYEFINIKLDKTGGLTEALALAAAARARNIGIMVGCMVGTSLAMAPAIVVAQYAKFIDLDGPMLLAADRDSPLEYRDGRVLPPARELWG